MNTFNRTIYSIPGALIVTAGLGLLMAGLIKAEFLPPIDQPDKLSFVINEPIIDIIVDIRKPPELKLITPPPAAPKIEVAKVGLPDQETFTISGSLPKIDKPEVKITRVAFTPMDSNVQPILRPAPAMPPRFAQGNNSGHCKVRFDVSANGSPFNVVATYCTSSLLERATVKAVLKWKFRPKIVDGQPTAMHGVKNQVTFRLLNERGALLPEI